MSLTQSERVTTTSGIGEAFPNLRTELEPPFSLSVSEHFSYNTHHIFKGLLYISLSCKVSSQEDRPPLLILVFPEPNTELGTLQPMIYWLLRNESS